MKKGSHHSLKIKQRISISQKGNISRIGKRHSDLAKQRISQALKGKPNLKLRGRKLSDEHKQKIGLGNKGKVVSEETKRKISLASIGKQTWLGKKHTKETRQKQHLAHLGLKPSHETIEKLKLKRLYRVYPKKDTKPERMMQLALQLQGIKFRTHEPITGQPDIFIEPNTCIFIDGCYWHGCQKHSKHLNEFQNKRVLHDSEINHKLTIQGYKVMRIWEHDILNNTDNCISIISKFLKSNELLV